MDLSTMRTDASAEKDGIWFELEDGTRLLVAFFGSPRYKAASQNAIHPHLHRLRMRSPESTALARKLECKAKAEALLLGWENLKLNGQEIPYSRETAEKLLANPEYRPFADLVDSLASDEAAFRSSVEEGEKKSPTTSGGVSDSTTTPQTNASS